jgi:hypothetical protein
MSDYFGALMQASGLSVDREIVSRRDIVPYNTPSPTDYGIVEVDEQIRVAHNESSVNRTMPLEPVRGRSDVATQDGTVRPEVGVTPIPSVVEQASLATTVPMVEAQASDPFVGDMPAIDEAPHRTSEPNKFHSMEPPRAGAAMVQAALRWVASGESHAQGAPEPESVPMRQVGPSVMPKEVQAFGRSEASMSKPVSKERLESFPSSLRVPPGRTQEAEDPVTLHDSVSYRWVQAHDPASENVVEVTIGSINVRVDAPPPPAVAVMAPSPALRAAAEVPPRSGLSRRTLWRI